MFRHHSRLALRPLVLPAVLTFLGLTYAAVAQAQDVYIAKNDTISSAVAHDVQIGYANEQNMINHVALTSPTVKVAKGAEVRGNVTVNNGSSLTISGGSISGIVFVADQSKVTISGGTIAYLQARSSGVATIKGGVIGNLAVEDNATLHLYGTDLKTTVAKNNTTERHVIKNNTDTKQAGVVYNVSGKLADGTVLHNTPMAVYQGAKFVLHNTGGGK